MNKVESNWNTEHPRSLEDLDTTRLLQYGFVDYSWHNDACPCFMYKEHLRLWCDYKDLADREIKTERFAVFFHDVLIHATEDYDDLLGFLQTHKPVFTGGRS